MSNWKDEDVATPALIKEYLAEFKEGILHNPDCHLEPSEELKVQQALVATEKFCEGLLAGKKMLYMHDLILMAIGYYGGYLSAIEAVK